jgi:broad specificity phosphatase PhoE
MDRPALLVLVRHGESGRNVAKKGNIYFADDESRRAVRGIPDHRIPITDEGKRQAIATGRALHQRFGHFDYLFHSGYLRTVETADGILSAFPEEVRRTIKVRQNLFIRERDSGHAYDMTTEEAEAAFPYLHDYWQTTGSFFAHPPGGESLAQVAERVYLFLNMLFRDRAGERILAVTHGGTLRAFRFLLERWTYEEAETHFRANPPKNCSVTAYEYEPGARRLVLRDYNSVYWEP